MTNTFRFRVSGVQFRHGGNITWPFDEIYEVDAEDPVAALHRLLGEIEWAILDSERSFSVELLPSFVSERAP